MSTQLGDGRTWKIPVTNKSLYGTKAMEYRDFAVVELETPFSAVRGVNWGSGLIAVPAGKPNVSPALAVPLCAFSTTHRGFLLLVFHKSNDPFVDIDINSSSVIIKAYS